MKYFSIKTICFTFDFVYNYVYFYYSQFHLTFPSFGPLVFDSIVIEIVVKSLQYFRKSSEIYYTMRLLSLIEIARHSSLSALRGSR